MLFMLFIFNIKNYLVPKRTLVSFHKLLIERHDEGWHFKIDKGSKYTKCQSIKNGIFKVLYLSSGFKNCYPNKME